MKYGVRFLIATYVCGAVLVGGATGARAQTTPPAQPGAGARPGGEKRKEMMAKMAKDLGLSPAQEKEMAAVRKNSMEQRKAIEASTLAPDAKKAKMQELMKTNRSQMGTILTPAQKTKWMEIMKARRDAHEAGRKTGAVPAPPKA